MDVGLHVALSPVRRYSLSWFSRMPEPTPLRVAVVLLAAGTASRMGTGRTKVTLAVDGMPMVRRAVQAATTPGVERVIVVTGHDADAVQHALGGTSAQCVHNPAYAGPTSTSLHCGLQAIAADIDAVIVVLADMIFTTSAMIDALIAAARASSAPLVVSRYSDVLAPPLLFRRALWPELLAWHGEGCGKAVVHRHLTEAVLLDWPPDSLRDVDTPDDYRELVQP
jgi:molybdenum cofactor cytidylyltransferase